MTSKNSAQLPDLLDEQFVGEYTSFDAKSIENFLNLIDQNYQANLGKLTGGISPAAINTAFFAWFGQLALCPGRLCDLIFYPLLHAQDCSNKIVCDERPGGGKDVRFHSENWAYFPWRLYAEFFLLTESWWQCATTNIPGIPRQAERTISFCMRQILDALSPSNFVWTNPDLLQETIRSYGFNLIHGTKIAMQDLLERALGVPPAGVENFIPGKQVAITPGKVIFHNHLIELIQYEPQTKTVYKEPLLILPAWIMKYYILDLSPQNSLVKWLVGQGHTVFIVSWRNPESRDRNLSMDDYYKLGAMAAINTISALFPDTKINLMGYCLGGTLALITAAAMAGNKDSRLNSLSLLAAQGDFSEAGELMLFVTESQVAFLKNIMWQQGYLDTKQMAGSFQMLRSYDLIWSKMVHDYMSGMQRGMIDLLAWNADPTRMPYKMHSEYLEKLFLHNDFASGRYTIEKKPVVARNIHLPVFAVSTNKDHVAPWRSVYKIHLMMNNPITFVLTKGGHNAGIVSQPGRQGLSYYIYEHYKDTPYLTPAHWLESAAKRTGSWWRALNSWLIKYSSAERVPARRLDQNLPGAPGTYVLQK